jgi:hypothetical protein
MKHFNQTIHDFAMDVLHRYKEDKHVVDNKNKQSSINKNMAESVIDKISPSNIRFYYEGWRNGKHGSICQTNGIYRFVEMTRGKSGMLDDVNRNEEENPIVAIGIVAYWLQFNSRMDTVIKRLTKYNCEIPKDIREQFDNYTKIRFEQFRKEHRDDPNTLYWDWEYEFYVNTIIPHEIAFNKQSEALFEYISDSDIALVRSVMNSYIKYLKTICAEKGYKVNEEGSGVVTPQTHQMPQPPKGSGQDVFVEGEEWDDTYDYIFDKKINPYKVKQAIETVKSERIKGRRFYYVAFRILKVLKWIPIETLESDYLKWINCHFKCGWEKNRNQKKAFLFNLEGTVKVLDDLHPSEWKDDLLYGKLGKDYRLLAISFKNTFTMTIINGQPVADSESYEHLKDRAEFLSGVQDMYGTLWAPEEAYINDGK